MADFEFLAKLRAAGVKSATLVHGDTVQSVEFFPRDLLDLSSVLPPGEHPETDPAPPPNRDEEVTAVDGRVPPALARLLSKGSVS